MHIWGVDDPVASTAVADLVWNEYLRPQTTEAYYFQLGGADRYLQHDQPEVVADPIRQMISGNLLPTFVS